MDDFNTIIRCLQRKKRAMHWTNNDIAGKSGYSSNTIARLMRGENVKMFVFFDVCNVMGIEVRVV